MKRVLIIAYYFPPMPEAGAVRMANLVRNAPSFGWEPTVIALRYPGERDAGIDARYVPNVLVRAPKGPVATSEGTSAARVDRTPNYPRRLLRSLYRWSVRQHVPDPAMGWIVPAYRAGAAALASRQYDAILSSALPASAHIVGNALARQYRLPWIADYRDLWTGYPYDERGFFRRAVMKRLERVTLRRATRITTISENLRADLATLHERSDVVVIPNGSSADEWSNVPHVVPTECSVLYAGMLYGGDRSPDLLFEALARLRAGGKPAGSIVFDFYTSDQEIVLASAHRFNVADAVRLHSMVPRSAILAYQRQAAGLAVILRNDPRLVAEAGSKIFEYLGAGRQIVATGPQGSIVADILARSGAGAFGHDVTTTEAALEHLYATFQSGTTEVTLRDGFRPFSASDLGERFARVLDEAIAR